MAFTQLNWAALVAAVNQAGVIVADDYFALHLDDVTDKGIGLKLLSSDEPELYCLICEKDNEEIKADGAGMFVTAHDGTEMTLFFYRTWVVADDASLRQEEVTHAS